MSFFPKFTARLLPIPPEHLRHIKKTKNRRQKKMDDYAIEFKEWSSNKYKYLKGKGWFQTTYELEMGIFSSTKELLEIFKKEKH